MFTKKYNFSLKTGDLFENTDNSSKAWRVQKSWNPLNMFQMLTQVAMTKYCNDITSALELLVESINTAIQNSLQFHLISETQNRINGWLVADILETL